MDLDGSASSQGSVLVVAPLRASKTHGHTDACPRKILYNLRKLLTFQRKTGKRGPFFINMVQFDKFIKIFDVFISILAQTSAQN